MTNSARVTVTLPVDLVERIDRLEQNRSRFLVDAAEHEIARRQRAALLKSLEVPHPETADVAAASLADWAASLPAEDERLVDTDTGTPVAWVAGRGWTDLSR